MEIRVGDCVRKKSGSQTMDVDALCEGVPSVRCSWHDKEGKPHSEVYPIATLEEVEKRRVDRPTHAVTGSRGRSLARR